MTTNSNQPNKSNNKRNSFKKRKYGNSGSSEKRKPFSYNKQKKFNYSRNRNSSKISQIEGIFKKYDYLLELHNIARKKYFEHHRNDNVQRNKLKQSYFSSMEQIDKLINSLPQDQKELLSKRNDPYPPDHSYSKKHNLVSEEIANNISENPHILTKQLESNFKNDTEETIGTSKDYAKAKAHS